MTAVVFSLCVFLSFTHMPVSAQDAATPTPEATQVVSVPNPPAPEQPPVDDGSTAALTLAIVIGFVGALERFVEMLKPSITQVADKLGLDEPGYKALTVAVSVALGIIGVLVSNQQLNLLASLPLIPPLVGTILTGAAAGFGSGAIHALFDIGSSITSAQKAKLLTAYATTPIVVAPKPTEVK